MKKAEKKTDEQIVAAFMHHLEHPLKNEIEAVRGIIKSANGKISERIKWNAPSYYYKEDLVTFNPRAAVHVHLVFHHRAVVAIKSDLLKGDYKDRRMLYLHNMQEIRNHRKELERIINELIEAIDRIHQ